MTTHQSNSSYSREARTDESARSNYNEVRQYLFDYLVEEFSRFPEVRLRVVPHAGEYGVTIRTEAREYFFPFEWAERGDFAAVDRLVIQIKSVL